MQRLAIMFAAVLAALSVAVAPVASADIDIQPVGSVPIPVGPAEAWIVADMDTGQVLAGRNDDVRYAPASTIKTLLAQVVLAEVPLEATIVADEADTRVECNCAGVAPGRTYTARQLLEALLLVSGNDAANTLARMLGGTDVAVAKMNARAAALGAHGTNVVTPSGLDGPGMPFWSTPHDLAVIFRAAMADPVFAQITAMPTAVFPAKTGDVVLVNQNELLHRYPGAIGGKTGFTDIARKTFVGAAQRDGRRLVVALMHGLVKEGGPTYWDQAGSLLDWGFALDRSANVGAL
ncbi:D-alanyl-D-alanine carboxypeptidase family protein [Mycolicibacterium baixiangningiae]|uniref:D-alanyl-D-alanine carboxypeptidase family protein n=1 Tax=Mycolicibacterium baixiangningiae TaxID=2761578 RepID=UPI0018D19409|nr:serine hydrolase [Mycolicibacterium baixiangningiae]